MATKVVVGEDKHTISVFWVIDMETDTIVGSTHAPNTARALASHHQATTHHLSQIRRVMMTVDHANHASPVT
jgi:hypothetical protein